MSSNILEAFDSCSVERLAALIDKLGESSFDYLELESEGTRIILGKQGVSAVSRTPSAETQNSRPAGQAQIQPEAGSQAVLEIQSATPAPARKTDVAEQAGVVVVRSPSYGLFYAQQEPGAAPFIQVGGTVKKGATIGLLEIMKTFNAVSSPVDGEVLAVHVKNEELLEPDQPLCSIRMH